MSSNFLIYGANGYTGELITRMAIDRGVRAFTARLVFILVSSLIPAVALAQAVPHYRYFPPPKLNDGIPVSNLRSVKLDEAKIVAGTNEILKGIYPNIHSLLIFRHGKLVYENYFTGEDQERGVGSLGVVTQTRESLHDMRSVTKSVVALAVLIAHSQGRFKSLDQPIFDIFPEHARYAQGEKKNIILRHLLTMTAGLEWDEQISYADPKNSEREMNNSADAVEYVLSKPLVTRPGTAFNYSGGMTQLLAAVIKRSTGLEVDQFTAKYLFSPLGISDHGWVRIVDVQPSAASGLRLRSRDMAKIGLMLMNNGKWDGKRIIPANLVRESLKPHARAPFPVPGGHVDYGYQIWLPTQTVGGRKHSWAEFEGNGGQIVILDKTNGILVAVTAGNYNQRDIAKNSADIFLDIVLPAIKGR